LHVKRWSKIANARTIRGRRAPGRRLSGARAAQSIVNHLAPWFLLAVAASAVAADPDAAEWRIRAMINEFRTSQGIAALTSDPGLSAAAHEFANYMARNGRYGHEADGRTPAERAKGQGYETCAVAENIAYQESTGEFGAEKLARIFMDGWKNSPGHRRNLLNTDVTQFGVAVARAKDGRYYGVQLFAQPASAMTNFEVRNPSAATVSYRLGETTYSLGPMGWRTHGICGAMKLSLPGAQTMTPRNGDRFTIGR